MFVVTPEEPQGVIILFDYSGSCLVIPLSFHKRASLFRPWFFGYPIEGAVMAFEIFRALVYDCNFTRGCYCLIIPSFGLWIVLPLYVPQRASL